MRIFWGFLIIAVAVILWMLPITQSVYDYRTDIYYDYYNWETVAANTTANVVLTNPIYNNDTNTITIQSDLATDVPLYSAYNTTTRLLDMTGLTAGANRTLTVYYDINALLSQPALSTLMDWLPYIWMIMVSVLPMAGIYAIIKYGRG